MEKNKMKKIIALLLCIILMTSLFTGCSKNKRQLYNVNLNKYVTLGEYKGIEVDTSSNEYKENFDSIINSDLENNKENITTGVAEKGDTVIIDYVGKKDGLAFDGGTANAYELTLGSGTFIPGFEEAIIGKQLGTKFTINVTFPSDYASTDLAGKAATFDITLHSKYAEPVLDDTFAKKMGFSSLDAYKENAKKETISFLCFKKLIELSEIKEYPKKDVKKYLDYMTEYYTKVAANNQMSFDQLLTANNMDKAQFKTYMTDNKIKPSMKNEMLLYAILDSEKIEITAKDLEEQLKKIAKEQGTTVDKARQETSEFLLESNFVYEKALEILASNAIVK